MILGQEISIRFPVEDYTIFQWGQQSWYGHCTCSVLFPNQQGLNPIVLASKPYQTLPAVLQRVVVVVESYGPHKVRDRLSSALL